MKCINRTSESATCRAILLAREILNIIICFLCAYILYIVLVWYEPTDVKKACKIFDAHGEWEKVLHFVSPNIKELFAMARYFEIINSDTTGEDEDIEVIKDVAEKLAGFVPVVITTMGADGLYVSD